MVLHTGQVNSDGECSSFLLDNRGDSQNMPSVTIPEPTWTQTPSIVKIAHGRSAMGMQYPTLSCL